MFLRWALADNAPPYGSWGNGAPMRVASIGWLARTEAEALDLAAAQAAVSHNHPDAVAAAQAVALAIFSFRGGARIAAVQRRIVEDFGCDLTPKPGPTYKFDVSAAGTAASALATALAADDWETAVRNAICLGGDADTLACITGAVAEAIHGLPFEIAMTTREYLTNDLLYVLNRFERELNPATSQPFPST
jgi:ADP-ribosyl-[dinitrogen reductase] hydrolase